MNRRRGGFTIVEVLIVIVVISVLAAITVVGYNGVMDRANKARIKSDLSQLKHAVMLARESTNLPLIKITGDRSQGNGGAMVPCSFKAAGTELDKLPTTDNCWTVYNAALDKISSASDVNVRGMIDPWGRPYAISERENEPPHECSIDSLSVYAMPHNGFNRMPDTSVTIPMTGYTGCPI